MSSVANWSYTAKATLWAQQSRDGWSQALTFAAPVVVACDYETDASRTTDAKGEEFLPKLKLYTERSDIQPGDRVALGVSTAADPLAAGALEVRKVLRQADVFERKADDFEVLAA